MLITLRQKIGQMLIIGFPGLAIDASHPVSTWLSEDGLGGVLLFDIDLPSMTPGKNLHNRTQIKALNQQLREAAAQAPGTIGELPLYIAIDYEGGWVDRLKNVPDCPKTIAPLALAAMSENEQLQLLEKMAETLSQLGFNLNFAPLLDLHLNAFEGIIGKLGRSFSEDPKEVIRLARQFVQVFASHAITCCYKHFPGHGSATADSHLGFVDVTETFEHREIEPYEALLSKDEIPAMVMTAHVINRELDPSNKPATLSHRILSEILREKIGFDGVIVSDDLQMKAVSEHCSLEESLKLTINAGADMLIFGNQLGNISAKTVIDSIENLVIAGEIPLERIEQSFQRIVGLKRSGLSCS